MQNIFTHDWIPRNSDARTIQRSLINNFSKHCAIVRRLLDGVPGMNAGSLFNDWIKSPLARYNQQNIRKETIAANDNAEFISFRGLFSLRGLIKIIFIRAIIQRPRRSREQLFV